jgi:hypothetical protein
LPNRIESTAMIAKSGRHGSGREDGNRACRMRKRTRSAPTFGAVERNVTAGVVMPW